MTLVDLILEDYDIVDVQILTADTLDLYVLTFGSGKGLGPGKQGGDSVGFEGWTQPGAAPGDGRGFPVPTETKKYTVFGVLR